MAAKPMAAGEWTDIAIKTGISLISGVGGLMLGVWRWGRKSAQDEAATKEYHDGRVSALREEVRKEMASHFQKVEDGNELLVGQFKESFEGIRRQHDEHKLDVERRFMLKDDFKDFREEYREDMRDIKTAIAAIARQQ